MEKLIDYIISTLFVIFILKYFPVFFSIDMFDPIQGTLEQMQISDIVYSQVRDYEDYPIDTNVILVNNGHLNRAQIAAMIEIINSYEPKVVAIDAFFRKEKTPELDDPLEQAFANTKNLILACELSEPDSLEDLKWNSVEKSNPKFNQYAQNAYANMYIEDSDYRTVRMIVPKAKVGGKVYYGLSTKIAQIYAPEKAKRYLARNRDIESINYKRNIDKYLTLNYTDVFGESEDLEKIRGKIVFIGYLGPEPGKDFTEDIFYTPMNPKYVGKAIPDMYGVVVHANALSMILEEDFINKLPEGFKTFVLLFVVILNMVLFRFFRDKYKNLYQPFTIIMVFGQLIFLSFLIIILLDNYSIELRLGNTFFAILVCVLCFETYTDSLKPIVVQRVRAYNFNRRVKRNKVENEKKLKEEEDNKSKEEKIEIIPEAPKAEDNNEEGDKLDAN